MKYIVIIFLILLGCTDDRSLDYDDFEARPSFQINFFEIEYPTELINSGNDSIPVPNTIRDFLDVDFLSEEFNEDYLESLEFIFLAENSINQPQTINFVFLDGNGVVTFRLTERIEAGEEDNPTVQNFSAELTPQEIDLITSSVVAQILISQPSEASNTGMMQIECILEASYLYTRE